MRQLYETVLRLYPADYRARFAAEMLVAFERAADDQLRDGAWASLQFAWTELTSLAFGIGQEWIAKIMADPSRRGRYLPDCRRMRPPGVTRAQWAAGLTSGEMPRGGERAD